MNAKDKEINLAIMREIGLDIGPDNRVYDQDSGMAIRIDGADIMAPGAAYGRSTAEFDPFNNRKMMNQLFGFFLEKHADETGVDCNSFYLINKKAGAGQVECKFSDSTVLTSGVYGGDSLKYADIIMQLNDSEGTVDLSEYDYPPENTGVKSKGVTKNGRKKKVSINR